MKYILLFILLFTAASCTLQLSQNSAEPGYPVDGLWVQTMDDEGHTRLLTIEHGGTKEYPYSFQFIEIYPRTLALSGRKMYISLSKGFVDTSKNEVLLIRNSYLSGNFKSKIMPGNVWQVDTFGRLYVDREFEKINNIDLLKIEKNGNELNGNEFAFKRALVSDNPKEFALTQDIGYVFQSDNKSKELLLYSFSPVLSIVNKNRIVWRQNAKNTIIRIKNVYQNFINASYQSGIVEPGSVVVMPGYKPNQKFERILSKKEVLLRLKQGLHVPQEDLIRVLGQDKKDSRGQINPKTQ